MLLETVDFFRLDANRKLEPSRRSDLGQFMTPPATARLMASLFHADMETISLLDAGAGVGSLTAAFVSEMCERKKKPKAIHATAYEIDAELAEYLRDTLRQCGRACNGAGIDFDGDLVRRDFIDDGVRMLRHQMFAPAASFNCAILNPPYKKIHSESETRKMLREIGVETSNLYTGFLSVVLNLLAPGGELVAITPRSFCNGPYFTPFRKLLLNTFALKRIHVFESRQVAFKEDEVLQENVIFHGVKEAKTESTVTISSSTGPEDEFSAIRTVPYSQVVGPQDPESFIHIVSDELGASIAEHIERLHWTLPELEIEVSTGRVVDFRAKKLLRTEPDANTAPLIYPMNFHEGFIEWPKSRWQKATSDGAPAGLRRVASPQGTYVLVKRFSAKEENRRIVAAIYDPSRIQAERVGFENHLNYFHRSGGGLPSGLTKGLTVFLNSTLVDLYFRQFSGHTQVNAADLRKLRYPTRSQLEALASRVGDRFPNQATLDSYIEEVLNLPDPSGFADP